MKAKIFTCLLFTVSTVIVMAQSTNVYTVNNNVNTTGSNNSLFGNNVGAALTTGAGNTYIGSTAGGGTNTNTNNTYVGYNATGIAGLTESGAIGADAAVAADRTIILGRANDATSTVPNVHVGIGATIAPAKLTVFNGPNPAILSMPGLGMEETFDCTTANFSFALGDVATASVSHSSNASNVGAISLGLDGTDYNAGIVAMGSGGDIFNVGLFGAGNGGGANRNWGVWGDVVVDNGLVNIGIAGIADDRCGTNVGAGTSINYGVYGQCDPLNTGGTATANNFAGFFSGHVMTTASVYHTSDTKLKENVNRFVSGLDKIRQLNFYTYNYRRNEFPQMNLASGKHYGILAQELEKVFPELVVNTSYMETEVDGKLYPVEEYKAVNYTELIPITMQAVQELDAKLDAINKLLAENGIDVSKLTDGTRGGGKKAYLEQNAPNPTSGETVIRYYAPEDVSKVMMVVMGINGEVVIKNPSLATGTHDFKIKTGDLSEGVYFYSLFCDNELIATKKMILVGK